MKQLIVEEVVEMMSLLKNIERETENGFSTEEHIVWIVYIGIRGNN